MGFLILVEGQFFKGDIVLQYAEPEDGVRVSIDFSSGIELHGTRACRLRDCQAEGQEDRRRGCHVSP